MGKMQYCRTLGIAAALSFAAITLAACSEDDVSHDLRMIDYALIDSNAPPAGLNNVVTQIRLAQSDTDRAELMRGFAETANNQVAALQKFDARSAEVEKARAAMAQGLEKASLHAARGGAADTAKKGEATPDIAAETHAMSAGFAQYQQGVRDLEAVARKEGREMRFNSAT